MTEFQEHILYLKIKTKSRVTRTTVAQVRFSLQPSNNPASMLPVATLLWALAFSTKTTTSSDTVAHSTSFSSTSPSKERFTQWFSQQLDQGQQHSCSFLCTLESLSLTPHISNKLTLSHSAVLTSTPGLQFHSHRTACYLFSFSLSSGSFSTSSKIFSVLWGNVSGTNHKQPVEIASQWNY